MSTLTDAAAPRALSGPNAHDGAPAASMPDRGVGTRPTVPWRPRRALLVAVVLTASCASTAPVQRAASGGGAATGSGATGGTAAAEGGSGGAGDAAGASTAEAAPLPSVSLPPELDRVLRDYEVAWAARSPTDLARLFTDDGFVLQPGRPPARGHDAILRAYAGGGGPLSLRALAYVTEGDVGYIVGAYARAAGTPDDGKFILLVRRAPGGGSWQIAADMDNGNRRR